MPLEVISQIISPSSSIRHIVTIQLSIECYGDLSDFFPILSDGSGHCPLYWIVAVLLPEIRFKGKFNDYYQ